MQIRKLPWHDSKTNGFIDGRHHLFRRGLVYHMTISRYPVENAAWDFIVKAAGLLINY